MTSFPLQRTLRLHQQTCVIWICSHSSDVSRQTSQRHGIDFVDEEVWYSGAVSKTSGPYVAGGEAVSSAVGRVLFFFLFQTSQFSHWYFSSDDVNALQRIAECPDYVCSTQSMLLMDGFTILDFYFFFLLNWPLLCWCCLGPAKKYHRVLLCLDHLENFCLSWVSFVGIWQWGEFWSDMFLLASAAPLFFP